MVSYFGGNYYDDSNDHSGSGGSSSSTTETETTMEFCQSHPIIHDTITSPLAWQVCCRVQSMAPGSLGCCQVQHASVLKSIPDELGS
jgi:hypothetical protein